MNQTILSLSRASRALSIGALLALGICGCTNDDLVDQTSPTTGEEAKVTLTARIESGVGTRTGHEEESATDPDKKGVKVTWAAGDKIAVLLSPFSTPSPAIFTLNGINSNGSGTFSGPAEPTPKEDDSDDYIIFYPPLKNYMVLSLPLTGQVQSGNNNMDHLGAYDLMMAFVEDWKSFSFAETDHVNALMTFDLNNIPTDLGIPKRIILGCTAEDKCFVDNSFNPGYTNAHFLTLDLTGFPAVTAGKQQIKAYMMLARTDIPAGTSLTITVEGDRNSYTYTSPAMGQKMSYGSGKRYTAKVTASDTWVKDASNIINYTGAEAAVPFDTKKGDGTQAKPFLIENAGHLRTLIDETNKSGSVGYTGTYFKLATNIDVQMKDDAEWTTIGESSTPFKGNFDGDGYTISGAMKGDASATKDFFGFFGVTQGATITNLTVNATVSGGGYVGGIVGKMDHKSSVSHCTNIGTVIGAYPNVGGIAGYMTANTPDNTFIIHCTNRGSIKGDGTESGNCGGIVGGAADGNLMACTNQGEVSKTGDKSLSCGGIVGNSTYSSIIIACYNTAGVSATSDGTAIAGIVGSFGGKGILTASYNTGKITATNVSSGAISGTFASASTTVSYCQCVLSGNTSLPIYPIYNLPTTVKENTKHATFAELNVAGVAALNAGITEWNAANAAGTAKHCPYHFVAGAAGGTPTLVAGAPIID